MLHESRTPGVSREEHIPELRSSCFCWPADQHRLKREIAVMLRNLLSQCADSDQMLSIPPLQPPSLTNSSTINDVVRTRTCESWRAELMARNRRTLGRIQEPSTISSRHSNALVCNQNERRIKIRLIKERPLSVFSLIRIHWCYFLKN